MSEDLGLGDIIIGEKHRDAIHIAVVPVTAGHRLAAGAKVVLVDGTKDTVRLAFHAKKMHIGVIDPFLTKDVLPGQKCWLYMNPGSITSLRHEWTHPAFKNVEDDVARVRAVGRAIDIHGDHAWFEEHAKENGFKVSEVIQAAHNYVKANGNESDLTTDGFIASGSMREFWTRFERMEDVKVPEEFFQQDAQSFYSCSC